MPNTIKTNSGRFKKGQVPWNVGIAMTVEAKEHLRELKLGMKLGPHSKEHKAKISLANTGKERTAEMREKMRQAKSFTSEETKLKMRNAKLGNKASAETKEKMRITHTGEKNPCWKGGATPLYAQIRNCFEYRQWRSDVFTRDSYTCRSCGDNRGRNLNAHHIIAFATLLQKYEIVSFGDAIKCEEMWNINNGITLCFDCHKLMHSKRDI